jgi:hypothetical protein
MYANSRTPDIGKAGELIPQQTQALGTAAFLAVEICF